MCRFIGLKWLVYARALLVPLNRGIWSLIVGIQGIKRLDGGSRYMSIGMIKCHAVLPWIVEPGKGMLRS